MDEDGRHCVILGISQATMQLPEFFGLALVADVLAIPVRDAAVRVISEARIAVVLGYDLPPFFAAWIDRVMCVAV